MPDAQPTTQFVPAAPAPVASRKPSCGYTLLIVVLTVVATIIAELIIGFFVVGYAMRTAWTNIQKDFPATPTAQNAGNAGVKKSGGTVKLTPDQIKLIESFGIKASDIPAEVPVEKLACVQTAIGNDRIQQILKGVATPSFSDLFAARGCIMN